MKPMLTNSLKSSSSMSKSNRLLDGIKDLVIFVTGGFQMCALSHSGWKTANAATVGLKRAKGSKVLCIRRAKPLTTRSQ